MEPSKRPNDGWTQFATSIFRLNGLIMYAGEDIARSVGQTSARWQVLGQAVEPKTVAQMARDIGQSRQNVQRIANALAREGLVAFDAHATDKRTQLVSLTPNGLAVIKKLYSHQLAWSKGITAELDEDQLKRIAKALHEVGDVIASNTIKEK